MHHFFLKLPERVTENLVIAKIPTLLHKLTSEAKINYQSKQGMETFCITMTSVPVMHISSVKKCCCSGLMYLFAKGSETRVSGPSDACSVQGNAKKQHGTGHIDKTKTKVALDTLDISLLVEGNGGVCKKMQKK